jgi:hypothetical protein
MAYLTVVLKYVSWELLLLKHPQRLLSKDLRYVSLMLHIVCKYSGKFLKHRHGYGLDGWLPFVTNSQQTLQPWANLISYSFLKWVFNSHFVSDFSGWLQSFFILSTTLMYDLLLLSKSLKTSYDRRGNKVLIRQFWFYLLYLEMIGWEKCTILSY